MKFYQHAVARWVEGKNVDVAAVIVWPIMDAEPGLTGYKQVWVYSDRIDVSMETAIVNCFFECAAAFGNNKEWGPLVYVATCPRCGELVENRLDRSLRPCCGCGTHRWDFWLRITRVETTDLTVANNELARIGRLYDVRFPAKPFT